MPTLESQIPPICGNEEAIAATMANSGPVALPNSDIDFGKARAAFAVALHMHQPLIPAGGGDLHTAAVIGNLQSMMENQGIGDNHNAPVFEWCYKRIGEFVPQLVAQGKKPRVMLEYSGCLFDGLVSMGATHVIDTLRPLTSDPAYSRCVEWLGAPWGHAVAPSTPVQDFRLHVKAWQNHFAALFGHDALNRVRGFSPSEMALPNHPDVCYEFVKTLKECGYRWVLVQEHTVEQCGTGYGLQAPHFPHRLVAKNSSGEEISIIAIIKTQGSDTKLVAQMQPYYEAKSLSNTEVKGKTVPRLVTQIADGENGGVMMNEFPGKFLEAMAEATDSETPAVNVTEYLEYLETLGIGEADFTAIQPSMQQKIWDRMPNGGGPEVLAKVIEDCKQHALPFHMDGGSWTNDISWVKGYDHVLGPMEEASALFAEKITKAGVPSSDPRYRNALYHLLSSQTSCYRYWGEGQWTDYGRELCRRAIEVLKNDF
jgi:hypothetical protein